MVSSTEPRSSGPHGAQTLTRGLNALDRLAEAPHGLTVQHLADALGVHRSVCYRLLTALVESGYAARSPEGLYRLGGQVLRISNSYRASLSSAVEPILRKVAQEMGCSISMLVEEGDDAVALLVISSSTAPFQLSFHEGSRHPLDRGAAGHALSSLHPPGPGDSAAVVSARAQGFSLTFGEVEPGIYGLAVPIEATESSMRACLNLITHRRDLAEAGAEHLRRAAQEVATLL